MSGSEPTPRAVTRVWYLAKAILDLRAIARDLRAVEKPYLKGPRADNDGDLIEPLQAAARRLRDIAHIIDLETAEVGAVPPDHRLAGLYRGD